MKIFVDENIPFGLEAFATHGQVIRFPGRSLKSTDLTHADALIIRSITKINASLLSGTSVRFVATATIGTDHVDGAYLQEQGIGFASAPGCNANSVGEYVSAALTRLEVEKGLTLSGKVLGIIGYGHVGKNVADKAQSLGLKVLYCDPPLRDLARKENADADSYSSLETILEKSDIISLHVPLVKDGPYPTFGMVDADFFQKLSRPIVLLNTCRGEIIHEPALESAMKMGRVKHLVLDVFAGEPNINAKLASSADIITPHIAGYSLQGKVNGMVQVYQAFCRFFDLEIGWYATYPGPAIPEIRYPTMGSDAVGSSVMTDAAFRQRCISKAYDMLSDEKRLRQSLFQSDPGKAFDVLRREYPIRHEFSQYTVHDLPPEKRELYSQLAKLGFKIL